MNLIAIKQHVWTTQNTVDLFTELDAYPLPRIEPLVNKLVGYQFFSTFNLKSIYYQLPLCDNDKAFTAFDVNECLCPFTWILFGVTFQ